jgi:hypothetical protein
MQYPQEETTAYPGMSAGSIIQAVQVVGHTVPLENHQMTQHQSWSAEMKTGPWKAPDYIES